MSKNCGQVNIPTVDNSSLGCDEIISSTCVTVVEPNRNIGNGHSESLSTVLTRIGDKLKQYEQHLNKASKALRGKVAQLADSISLTRGFVNLGVVKGNSVEDALSAVDTEIGILKNNMERVEDPKNGLGNSDNVEIQKSSSILSLNQGDSLTRLVGLLDNKFSLIKAEFDKENDKHKLTTSKLNNLENKISKVGSYVNTTNANVSVLNTKLGEFESSVGNLSKRFDNLDYRAVKIVRGNTYFGMTGESNLSDFMFELEKRLDSLKSKDASLANNVSAVKANSERTSNAKVDIELKALSVKSGTPLNNVLSKIDNKFSKYSVIDTSDIEVVNDEISDSSETLILDELLGRHNSSIQDLSEKFDILREQFKDLKNQVDTLRRKG